MIPRFFVVAESAHQLQNPISEAKLVLLGARLGLDASSRVLDIASGRGGPALVLAREYGCHVDGVEVAPEFRDAAVARAEEGGLAELVSFELADASAFVPEAEVYDAALCLGASFVYGGLAATVDALSPAVKPGGHVVVGEPYWRRLPLPADYADRDEQLTTLEGTVDVFETCGPSVVDVIASSEGDWDRYETLHWSTVERWLAEHPDDPDAPDIRSQHERYRRTYLRYGRDYLGWAIFVGWKRPY